MLNYCTLEMYDSNNNEFLQHALEECRKLYQNEGREVREIGEVFSLEKSYLKEQMEIGKNADMIFKSLTMREVYKKRKCPHCGNENISRYGKYKDRQRYKCRDEMCGRTFTDLSNTVFASSKKSMKTWFRYIILMFSGATLRKISREVHINIQTAFNWRHKIIESLKGITRNRKISGVAQIGEVKFCERWGEFRSKRRPGIIYTAVEHTGRIIAKLAYEKEEKSIEFKKIFGEIIKDGTYIARPQNFHFKKYLEDISKNMQRNLEIMRWNNRINGLDCFRIAKVNLNIKFMIGKFRGIKMKYLQDYLNWFTWSNDSVLKYGGVNVEEVLNMLIFSQS